MNTSLKIKRTVLALALAAAYPLQAFAVSAGVAQFIAGDVNVRRPDGQTNPLAKGKDIESGQAIVTGTTGRAQVKFTDGGLISLQPNTELKIASYVDKADPQEDRFLVDFLRGSMRAITGLIGKRNRANYKVTTTTATIGIRGSGFSAGYNPDGTLGVTAEKDAIEVCSGGSCVGLVAGESVKVNSSNEPPVRTSNRASVPTPPPAQEVVTAGNQTTSDGKSALFAGDKPTGTFTNLQLVANYNATAGGTTLAANSPASGTTLVDGRVTAFSDANAIFSSVTLGEANTVGTISGGDFVGWGVWVSGTRVPAPPSVSMPVDRLHYAVGVPTGLMPTTGTAAYSLIGSTAPTREDGVAGILSSASFSANFQTGYVSASLVTNFAGNLITTSASTISISGSAFSDGSTISGNFFGANAARAGLVYGGYDNFAYKSFSGAAVFQK